MKSTLTLALAAILASAAVPAATQEPAALPAVCTEAAAPHGMGAMGMAHPADAAHADLMAGMDETNAQMMQAMMAEDIDVAFVCGMIPHHQGAIDMARVVLKTGDNAEAKKMAETVIKAQEQEIVVDQQQEIGAMRLALDEPTHGNTP